MHQLPGPSQALGLGNALALSRRRPHCGDHWCRISTHAEELTHTRAGTVPQNRLVTARPLEDGARGDEPGIAAPALVKRVWDEFIVHLPRQRQRTRPPTWSASHHSPNPITSGGGIPAHSRSAVTLVISGACRRFWRRTSR